MYTSIILDVPKFISSSPLDVNMTKGDNNQSLMCEYRGLPQPRILWYRDNSPVESGERYLVEERVTSTSALGYKTTISTLTFKGEKLARLNELNQEYKMN